MRREPIVRRTVRTTDGRTLEGQVLGEGFDDLQLRTDDKRVHLFGARATASGRDLRGRLADLQRRPGRQPPHDAAQIDKTNVARLAPQWMATMPDGGQLQVTPVVVGGIMYVTAPNECVALDAGQRPAPVALQTAAHPGHLRAAMPTAACASPAIACS